MARRDHQDQLGRRVNKALAVRLARMARGDNLETPVKPEPLANPV